MNPNPIAMRHLLPALLLLLLPGCLSFSFHDHRSAGSHTEDDLRVRWDLRRGSERTRAEVVDVQIDAGAPIEEVEILFESEGLVIERRRVFQEAGGARERIRGLILPAGADIRLQVLVHPADGSEAYRVVDTSISSG